MSEENSKLKVYLWQSDEPHQPSDKYGHKKMLSKLLEEHPELLNVPLNKTVLETKDMSLKTVLVERKR